MIINVILSLALFPYWGAMGIALATSLAAWANAAALAWYARKQNWLSFAWQRLGLILLAALLMAFALIGVQALYPLPDTSLARIFYLASLVLFGGVIYFTLCHILKLAKLNELKQELL